MTAIVINSDTSLQSAFGLLRELYQTHRYIKADVQAGTDRSLPQNSISHVWYQQMARELREETVLGWRCYCKLHHGVPILRAEDSAFKRTYDRVIKPLSYELKIEAMRDWPVTSRMKKTQIEQYFAAVQADFSRRGVRLEFPEVAA